MSKKRVYRTIHNYLYTVCDYLVSHIRYILFNRRRSVNLLFVNLVVPLPQFL